MAEKVTPFPSDYGGGREGDMEQRVTVLETRMEHIQEDMRDIKLDLRELRSTTATEFTSVRTEASSNTKWIIASTETMAALMLTVMAKGFGWF